MVLMKHNSQEFIHNGFNMEHKLGLTHTLTLLNSNNFSTLLQGTYKVFTCLDNLNLHFFVINADRIYFKTMFTSIYLCVRQVLLL